MRFSNCVRQHWAYPTHWPADALAIETHDTDLDRTDKLPILAGTVFDEDVEDDAVRLDYAPAVPSVKSEFPRAAAAAPKAVGSDSAGLRALLESEQERSRELERALAGKHAAAQAEAQAARVRFEEALGEAEQRHQSELRTLRATLSTHEATLGQVSRSLAERDAQLSALQREHAQVVPALEERSRLGTQLEAELRALRTRYEAMCGDLQNARQSSAALAAQLEAGTKELDFARRELNHAQLQAATYLEQLRTREWRRGFAHAVRAPGDRAALQRECDRLRARVIETEAKLAERDAAIAHLKAAPGDEAQREKAHAELAAHVKRLQSEAQTREDENAVLLAHLREARRPVESPAADSKLLTAELAIKTRAIELLNEENRTLRGALEHLRSSLEEREFLIRRLERSETGAVEMVPMECTAELVRVDGQHKTSHTLGRRTRIGRAPSCELHIPSTSVSRHHALLHVNSRDVVIEDLNSTNGVLVNGRRISRQLLNDGDLLTIGEAQFRLTVKLAPPEPVRRTP